MTTPTTNPVPSSSPLDLLFNAEKLDQVINGDAPNYVDRLGVGRLTAQGVLAAATATAEAELASVGYAPPVAYTAGISLTTANQTVSFSGVVYAPKLADLPFTTSGTFETAKFRVVQGALASQISELRDVRIDHGAAVNGSTDDLTALNAALVNPHPEVFVQEGDLYVSATPADAYGPKIGPGRVLKTITGGRQQLNVTVDDGQNVFGQEYLSAWFNAIRSQFGGASAKVVLSGDSTTYGAGGNGATSPFLLQDLMVTLAANAGYKVTAVNRGQPGQNTYHWRTTYLAGDIAEAGKLLVLRWGINDPGWLKNNTTPPLDSGQDYPNRRDITDFASDLRQGLATIRATVGCDLANLSILLMTPNGTADTPNGRDERWYEQVRRVVRKAARDYDCACIDTYAIWGDTRPLASLMMDDPFADGRGIHPNNIFNSIIVSKMAELLFPVGLRSYFFPGAYGTQSASARPDDFKVGLNMQRIASGDGWPAALDGSVITLRTPDDFGLQVAWQPGKMPAIRIGSGATWDTWLSRANADISLLNSWVAFITDTSIRASKSWKVVTLSGAVKSGTTTVGTVIGNLPAGFRPYATQWFAVPCGANFDQLACLQVQTDGDIAIQACPSNAGLSVSGIQFEAFN
jgi:hypothetical protein